MSTAPLTEIEKELAKLPPAVLEAYQEANPSLEAAFGEEELGLWAKEGLTIGTQTVRSWESAVEYYRVGPQGGPVPFLSVLYAVGPLWDLSGPGLPHISGGLLSGQLVNRAQSAAPVHPSLGRLGPEFVQGHLEIQHTGGQVF